MFNDYKDIKKVLFVRFGAIGDVVHTTAAYQTLRSNVKNIIIDYLTSPFMQELLCNDQMLRQIISLDEYTYEGLFRKAQELSSEDYDLIVNLQPSLKTRFFSMVMNARKTLVYKKFKPGQTQEHIHAVKNFYETINPVIPGITIPENLKLYLDPNAVKKAKQRLLDERIHNPIGIVPGVSHNKTGRLWPTDHWKALLDYLTNSKHLEVIIFGGSNESELASELQNINKNKIRNYCGKLSISNTAAILSLCLGVIGCDTGPTHIASAVCKRVIGLYGQTDPKRTGIYGSGHSSIHSNHDCLFCEKKTCPYMNTKEPFSPCMQKLLPEQVIEAIGI